MSLYNGFFECIQIFVDLCHLYTSVFFSAVENKRVLSPESWVSLDRNILDINILYTYRATLITSLFSQCNWLYWSVQLIYELDTIDTKRAHQTYCPKASILRCDDRRQTKVNTKRQWVECFAVLRYLSNIILPDKTWRLNRIPQSHHSRSENNQKYIFYLLLWYHNNHDFFYQVCGVIYTICTPKHTL